MEAVRLEPVEAAEEAADVTILVDNAIDISCPARISFGVRRLSGNGPGRSS